MIENQQAPQKQQLAQSQTEVIEKTIEYVKQTLQDVESGHAYDHIERVLKLSIKISETEQNCNLFVIQLGALLHDISDHKFNGGDCEMGGKVSRQFLLQLNVDNNIIDQVCDIVNKISYKGANVANELKSIEGLIVQDADRLEALGAIGIARTFSYGGNKGRKMYDPNEKAVQHTSFEQYKNSQSCTINHFYEKLFLLKDRMNTQTAKKIAEERHKFMEDFVNRFLQEWEGQI